MKSSPFTIAKNSFYVIFGNILYALTVVLFLEPAGLITGGATGIGIALHRWLGFSLSLTLLIINIIMLVIGYFLLGKKFAATTLASTFLLPAAIEFFERILVGQGLTDDLLLNTLFAGIGTGVSLGLVFRAGASTGGMDIPPLVLHKYFKWPVSVTMWVLDIIVLVIQIPGNQVNCILYSIVMVIVYTVIIDKMMILGTEKTQLVVVSKKYEEIKSFIVEDVDRGVTFLSSEGGFSGDAGKLILSVVSNREVPRIERMIREIDPVAFVIINRVNEVQGRGFTLENVDIPSQKSK